jgi:alkane 1-monooxygenase
MGKIKYIGAYIVPVLALLTFHSSGIYAFFGLIFLYILVPVLEQIFTPDNYNFTPAEKELAQEDTFYDLVLSLMVPLHLYVIYEFLVAITAPGLTTSSMVANVLMMGTLLGISGINIGHELGHKTGNPFKMFLAHVMLTTAVQNHFIPYHNGGHHRDVGTPADLTSAEEGDIFYFFALRSQIGGYFKTWNLEAKRLKAQGKNPTWNPMIIYTILPILLLAGIFVLFGGFATLCYFLASVFGISILESQNYFSHYGLRRKKQANGRYERVKPHHSWNSDHLIGRVLLFELTRHSDHHHMGAKSYQTLESDEDSPKLPYGYPMMLVLAYFPFLFRPIMKRHLELYRAS